MKGGSSLSQQDDLAARLRLLQSADGGQLDGLRCPHCGEPAIAVWFTRRSEDEYWTWFICDECRFEMRAQGSRPRHYSQHRDRSAPPAEQKTATPK